MEERLSIRDDRVRAVAGHSGCVSLLLAPGSAGGIAAVCTNVGWQGAAWTDCVAPGVDADILCIAEQQAIVDIRPAMFGIPQGMAFGEKTGAATNREACRHCHSQDEDKVLLQITTTVSSKATKLE